MKVKICGITNLEDALAAAAAGADYIGFVFYPPSSRSIEPTAARDIAASVKERASHLSLVGVFVDASPDSVARTLEFCRLDLAQLSGDEPPAMVMDVTSPIYERCYKAVRPRSLADAEVAADRYLPPDQSTPPSQPALLVDTYHPTMPGGSGETGNWEVSARMATQVPGLMLAGGLTPANVVAAVRQVRPFAVDVASGVEAHPGKKDHALVAEFICAARKAVESLASSPEESQL